MDVGNPEEAFSLSGIPNDGMGLARMEFIILNSDSGLKTLLEIVSIEKAG